jgi:hypothetical protein
MEAHVAINEAAKAGVPVSNFDPDALSEGGSTKSPMSQIGSVLKEKPPTNRGEFLFLHPTFLSPRVLILLFGSLTISWL